MDKNDLEQIRTLVREEIGGAIEGVIMPVLDIVMEDIHGLKADVGGLKADVAELKIKVGVLTTRYPDKAYLDDKINDLRGDILAGRKLDSARVDKHISFHHQKGALSDDEVEELYAMRPFAPLPV